MLVSAVHLSRTTQSSNNAGASERGMLRAFLRLQEYLKRNVLNEDRAVEGMVDGAINGNGTSATGVDMDLSKFQSIVNDNNWKVL